MLTLLLLLGTLGPMPIVCLVPVELLFTRGFLRGLRAGLSCISTDASILQSQDSPMEHCKALPGRAGGTCFGLLYLLGQGHIRITRRACYNRHWAPICIDSAGMECGDLRM